MNYNQTKSEAFPLARCAVCKIDLKGRFVYVDDQTAELLESTKEDLFGHSFLECIAEESHEIVDQLINSRSHYESFYESIALHLLTAQGRRIRVAAVVSLNFIAGNPVNFQFILHPLSEEVRDHVLPAPSNDLSAFIDSILSIPAESAIAWFDIAAMLTKIARGHSTLVYYCEDGALHLVADIARGQVVTPPPVSRLHHRIAEKQEEYNPLSEKAVRIAVQEVGEAPSEFIMAADCGQAGRLLFRVLFRRDQQAISPVQIGNVRRAISVLGRTLKSDNGRRKAVAPVSEISWATVLDPAGIAAVEFERNGSMVVENAAFRNLLNGGMSCKSFGDMVDALMLVNTQSTADLLYTWFQIAHEEQSPPAHNLNIRLPNGNAACLTLFALDDMQDRRRTFVTLTPLNPVEAVRPSVPIHPANLIEIAESLTSAVQAMDLLVSGDASGGDPFEERRSAPDLPTLRLLLEGSNSILEDARELFQALRPYAASPIELQSLLNRTLDRVSKKFPGIKARISCPFRVDLVGPESVLSRLFSLIMKASLCRSRGKLQITVEYEQVDNNHVIRFSEHLTHGKQFASVPLGFRNYVQNVEHDRLRRPSRLLTLARCLVQSLGGDLSNFSHKRTGSIIEIRLPVIEPPEEPQP